MSGKRSEYGSSCYSCNSIFKTAYDERGRPYVRCPNDRCPAKTPVLSPENEGYYDNSNESRWKGKAVDTGGQSSAAQYQTGALTNGQYTYPVESQPFSSGSMNQGGRAYSQHQPTGTTYLAQANQGSATANPDEWSSYGEATWNGPIQSGGEGSRPSKQVWWVANNDGTLHLLDSPVTPLFGGPTVEADPTHPPNQLDATCKKCKKSLYSVVEVDKSKSDQYYTQRSPKTYCLNPVCGWEYGKEVEWSAVSGQRGSLGKKGGRFAGRASELIDRFTGKKSK
ncbi:hypothetical protein IAR55_004721 [Kwoniella newhampshirensis]|uniref:Uncharacterized protein n=1 Tax=Kwoniella newhampshirensis TaxID=1651941 RepID=A0AAW0YIA3_9TREE